ncbi:MAG: NAD-dependent epimerase/dehydratase family protein [Thermoleophilaceae bacterium]
MKACVTGATGFLGAHLVDHLVKRRVEVRATYRDKSRLTRLGPVATKVDAVKADVLDGRSMRRAFKGCDVVFHTAGYVGANPPARVWEMNALSPRLAVEAAAAAGVPRLVLTSSIAAVGAAGPDGQPVREDQPYLASRLRLTYGDAKHEGEVEAMAAAGRTGVEVIIVNPAYVLGAPIDRSERGETSTRIVGNYLRGRLPAIVDGGASIVDVRDVARGHLRAARRGKPGERYILAGHNVGWVELIDQVAQLSGIHHPLAVIPREAAGLLRAPADIGLPTGLLIDPEAYGLMAARWWASSAKAQRKLDYRFGGLEETLGSTIEWYTELIDTGAFEDDGTSRMALLAAGMRAGERLGLVRLMQAAERRTGRRLVAGA